MATLWEYGTWFASWPYSWGSWTCYYIKWASIYTYQGVVSTPGYLNYIFWNAPAAVTYVAVEAPQATVKAAVYGYNTTITGFWLGYEGIMYYPKWSYYSWVDIAPGQYGKALLWGVTNGAVWSIMLWWYTGVLESHLIDWDIE